MDGVVGRVGGRGRRAGVRGGGGLAGGWTGDRTKPTLYPVGEPATKQLILIPTVITYYVPYGIITAWLHNNFFITYCAIIFSSAKYCYLLNFNDVILFIT